MIRCVLNLWTQHSSSALAPVPNSIMLLKLSLIDLPIVHVNSVPVTFRQCPVRLVERSKPVPSLGRSLRQIILIVTNPLLVVQDTRFKSLPALAPSVIWPGKCCVARAP